MTQKPYLTLTETYKHFGHITAVDGVSFTVSPGQCVGLLGPNGAGKTTTMRMILGLAKPTSGTVRAFGEDSHILSKHAKRRIGLVPQEDNLDRDLTTNQNLDIYGSYFGMTKAERAARIPELLDFMQLTHKKDSKITQLSGGMKRRVTIARALINNPDLLILDEPTTGLDPQARRMIWHALTELKNQGKALLLTTHYMAEAEDLCDHIVMIDHGKIITEGSPAALIRENPPATSLEDVFLQRTGNTFGRAS